jgi:hypothetical protein
MMSFLSILKFVLGVASALAEYAKNKQLIDAGAAQAVLKGVQDADEAISRANAARTGKLQDADTDPNNRDNAP